MIPEEWNRGLRIRYPHGFSDLGRDLIEFGHRVAATLWDLYRDEESE